MYQKHPAKENLYVFAGLWNPESEPDDTHVVVPLRSSFGGAATWEAGKAFANIIGSSDDLSKSRVSSWLNVFRALGIPCDSCMTDGNYYNPSNDMIIFNGCNCSPTGANMVGGHVVEGRDNPETADIIGALVFLVPICNSHNTKQLGDKKRTGSTYYMKIKSGGSKVVILNCYFQPVEKPFPQKGT